MGQQVQLDSGSLVRTGPTAASGHFRINRIDRINRINRRNGHNGATGLTGVTGNNGIQWVIASSPAQLAVSNTGYLADNTVVTLPVNPQPMDLVKVVSYSSHGFTINPNGGQQIRFPTATYLMSSKFGSNSSLNGSHYISVSLSKDGHNVVLGSSQITGLQISTNNGVTWVDSVAISPML